MLQLITILAFGVYIGSLTHKAGLDITNPDTRWETIWWMSKGVVIFVLYGAVMKLGI